MNIVIKYTLLCCGLFLLPLHFSFANPIANQTNSAASPVGFWQTIDDVSGKPKGVVELWEVNHVVFGRIREAYSKPGHVTPDVCAACTGAKHNQPIKGLVFMENLRQNPDAATMWQGGTILDPKNGKVYHANIQLTEHGQKLNVRGYIGIPLFGRMQTWIRLNNPNQIAS